MTPSLNYDNLIKNVRKLVPFLPPEPISPRNTKKQDTSPLYAKLPPELRQMIWITYFHGHAVHLVIRGKKLCGKECLNWEGDFSFRGHSHMGSCRKRGTQLQCGHISLALTCKKIYFECIQILYRETSFDCSHLPRSIPTLLKRLPAAHVANVSRVNLNWLLFHPLYLKKRNTGKVEIIWVQIWEALAAMKGLEWLRVELRLTESIWVCEWTRLECTFWELIKKVTRPTHFELILPFPAAASTREEMLPCTIIRQVNEQ